jgi:hypothetical protein
VSRGDQVEQRACLIVDGIDLYAHELRESGNSFKRYYGATIVRGATREAASPGARSAACAAPKRERRAGQARRLLRIDRVAA